MEMKPRRKRGRPRKYPLPQDSAAGKPPEVSSDDRMKVLEEENRQLKNQMEVMEEKEKGITSEQLARRSVLTEDEKNILKKRIQEDEMMLEGKVVPLQTENWGTLVARHDLIQHKEDIKRDLVRAKLQLAHGDVGQLSAKNIAKLKERKQKLDTYLKERKANIGDGWDIRDRYKFNQTVQNRVKFEEECGDLCRELKSINKILDPNNPNAGNLGYLEPKRKKD